MTRSSGALITRPATLDDLDALLRHVRVGFASYVEFAPAGWQPPAGASDRERTAELLAEPQTWALLAVAEGAPVGHVAFLPARELVAGEHWRRRPVIPGLASLWHLFVLPPWWGQGAAPLLHDAALVEMRTQGYEQARLFTPSAHARARRFYERRGWEAGAEIYGDQLDLDLTEYTLELSPRHDVGGP